jgi:hypothetical protein
MNSINHIYFCNVHFVHAQYMNKLYKNNWKRSISESSEGEPYMEASSRHRTPPFRQLLDGHALAVQTLKKY